MANNGGTITRKDIIEDQALRFGEPLVQQANNVISANNKLIESFKQLNTIANAYRGADNMGKVINNRQLESNAITQVVAAMKQEQQAIVDLQNKITELTAKQATENELKREKARLALESKQAIDSETLAHKQSINSIKEAEAAEIALERTKQQKLKTEKAEAQAIRETERATRVQKDAYGELSAELNKMFRQTASVAVEMYKLKEAGQANTPAYDALQKKFVTLRAETLKLDGALKGIDASLGRNQRNVGNYKFDALGNSIQQILRESPSAAVSLNTFFLAISNNLPAFFDAFTNAKRELTDLKKAAIAANLDLARVTMEEQAVAAIAVEAETALANQVDTVIKSSIANEENALTIRNQVAAHISEIETTGVATSETIANTQAILANAGATEDEILATQQQIIATADANLARNKATSTTVAQTVATKEANAALSQQPTLLQRLSSSLFSVNTALTLGVLALTLYGGKLVDFVSGLFGADKALKNIKESQEALNKAQLEGLKATVADERSLRSNLKIAQDKKLSDEEREIALKKLRSQYPFYFKNLTDEEILLGKTAKAEADVISALNKRAEAEQANNQIIKNRQRILELDEEQLKSSQELEKATKKVADAEALSFAERSRGQLLNSALDERARIQSNIAQSQNEINKLNAQNISYEDKILKLQKESIGLDFQPEKEKKVRQERQKRQKQDIDYLAEIYALTVQYAQNEIDINNRIMQDDTKNFDIRLEAATDYYDEKSNLLELERIEQQRLNELEFNNQTELYTKAIATGQATYENLLQLQQKYTLDKELIDAQYENKKNQLAIESALKLKGVLDSINDQTEVNLISSKQIDSIRELNKELNNVSAATSYERFKELEERKVKIATESNEEIIRVELRRVQAQIEALKADEQNSQYAQDLREKEIKLQTDLANVEQERLEKTKELVLDLKRATDDYLNTFASGFLQNAGLQSAEIFFKIEENGKTAFENLLNGADSVEEKFRVIFNAIGEVAKESFGVVVNAFNEFSQAKIQSIDDELSALEESYSKQAELAKNDKSQKEALDKEYEIKREKLEQKKREEQRKQAIYNKALKIVDISISTAQAIMQAYAQTGPILGSIFAALIGALGAVQLATVVATPIPKYKTGRKGGKAELAYVGDGGVSEVIESKSGKAVLTPNKATLTMLEEGDIVHKTKEDYIASQRSKMANSMKAEYNKVTTLQNMIDKSKHGNSDIEESVKRAIKEGFKNAKVINQNNMPKIDLDHAIWAFNNRKW